MSGRRKLCAVDDSFALGTGTPPAAPVPAAPASRQLPTLFVRLPVEQTEALARAAFELRVHKRELVAAPAARYVVATPDTDFGAIATS